MRWRIGRLLRLWEIRREMRDDLEVWSLALFITGNIYLTVSGSTNVCMDSEEGWPYLFRTPTGYWLKVSRAGRWWKRHWTLRVLTANEALQFLAQWYDTLENVMLVDVYEMATVKAG